MKKAKAPCAVYNATLPSVTTKAENDYIAKLEENVPLGLIKVHVFVNNGCIFYEASSEYSETIEFLCRYRVAQV